MNISGLIRDGYEVSVLLLNDFALWQLQKLLSWRIDVLSYTMTALWPVKKHSQIEFYGFLI